MEEATENFEKQDCLKQDSGGLTPEELKRVISALEDPKFDWRTFLGIVNDTHLPDYKVRNALNKLKQDGKIVQTEKGYPKEAYPVYTTVKHYIKKDIVYRLQSVFSDKVR